MNAPEAVLRVGLFGGAFDPPHNAHVALARVALAQLGLERLHVVPTGSAWHKPRTLSDAVHRLAMTQLAFRELPGVCIDTCEIERPGASYTIDTLLALRHQYGRAAHLFLIIGADQARALPGWQRADEILQIATICIASRADATRTNGQFGTENQGLPANTGPDLDSADWLQGSIRLRMPALPLAATEIRTLHASHQNISALVPERVAHYIENHHLYLAA